MKKINEYAPVQTDGILLNANESPFDFDAYIKEELVKLLSSFSFQRYPNDTYEELLKAYAAYAKVNPDQIICGNGSDELLGLIIGLTITTGKKLLTFKKDFGMYNYYTSMFSGEVVTYDQPITEPFNPKAFIEEARKQNVSLVMISNPNNPTGKLVSTTDLKEVLTALEDITVVIDEAYIEFAPEGSSMMPYIEEYKNLVVTRTLSKAFGLASIRCGFMAASAERMAAIRTNKVPFNVSTFTEKAATLLLNQLDYMKKNVSIIQSERDLLYSNIQKLSPTTFTVYPSSANFLYLAVKDKQSLLDAFKAKDITIRNYKDNTCRITIGTKEDNALVFEILKEYEVQHA